MRDGDDTAERHGGTLALPDGRDGFPPAVRHLVDRVDRALHHDDGMYVGDDAHYVGCGASALDVILTAQQAAGVAPPASILDFGSGAGRVTRWIRVAFPDAALSCCDLRAEDLDFCRDRFGAETWVSGTDVAALHAPSRYDLVWLGSVLTHLSADVSRALLARICGWTRPGGLVVASTIGRAGKAQQEKSGDFIHPEGWRAIETAFVETGFGYADYTDHEGYGLSLIAPSWLARTVESTAGLRLVLLAERVWDGLHDIVAVQNDGSFAAYAPRVAGDPRDGEIAALKARVEALESSTSWRLTAPLRRVAGLMR